MQEVFVGRVEDTCDFPLDACAEWASWHVLITIDDCIV